MKIVLYSTHCPKCLVLEKKLKQKGICFEEVYNIDVMRAKGFLSAPMLEVDEVIMDFATANKWINEM